MSTQELNTVPVARAVNGKREQDLKCKYDQGLTQKHFGIHTQGSGQRSNKMWGTLYSDLLAYYWTRKEQECHSFEGYSGNEG